MAIFDSSPISSSQPQLPLELLDQIASYVAYKEPEWQKSMRENQRYSSYNDEEGEAKDALLACSTASRQLRHATLPYLFHTLAMQVDPYLEGTVRVGCDLYRGLYMVQDFLDGPDCPTAIRHAIQEIRMKAVRGDDGYDPPYLGATISIKQLVEMFHRLPRLRIVCLRDVWLAPNTESSDNEAIHRLGPLPALDLFQIDMSREQFYTILSNPLRLARAFADVKCVSLDGLRLLEVRNLYKTIPLFPTGMRSLKVLRCDFVGTILSAAIRDISESSNPMPIESLELENVDEYTSETVIDLLALVAPSLRKLSLYDLDDDLIHSDAENVNLKLLQLSSCSKLESVALRWSMWSSSPSPTATGLCRVLPFLHGCPNIRKLSLCVHMDNEYALQHQEILNDLAAAVEKQLLQLNSFTRITVSLLDPVPQVYHERGFRMPAFEETSLMIVGLVDPSPDKHLPSDVSTICDPRI